MRQFGLDYCHFRYESEEYLRLVDAYNVWQLTTEAAPLVEKAIGVAKSVERCRYVHRVEQLEKNQTLLESLETEAGNLLKTARMVAADRLKDHEIFQEAKNNMIRLKSDKALFSEVNIVASRMFSQ